jgi:hypothetical protein
MSRNLGDTMSLTADSDVYSTRKTYRQEDLSKVESTYDPGFVETSVNDESLLEPWRKYDLKYPRSVKYWDWRVFRPSYVIKSSFQCLYLTGDNMKSFTDCLARDGPNTRKWLVTLWRLYERLL